jgi:hypothetical protein
MKSNTMYVRVQPYNKNTGALAQRVNIDGKLFESGNWYTMSAEVAVRLGKLRQKTGAPMFQICSPEDYRETSRHELSAMAVAAGLKGLALQSQSVPEPKSYDQKKVKKSKFAGLGNQVTDVDPTVDSGTMTTAHLREQDPGESENANEESEERTIDVSTMKRPQLEQLCKANNVTIPFGSTNTEIRQLLRDQGIVE